MLRFVTVLSVTVILVLAANAAFAGFEFGNWYFGLNDWGNGGGGYGMGPSFTLPDGPTATTDGAIWEKTGPGPLDYVLNTKDVNIAIDFRDTNTGGTVYTITNTCLLSTGVATNDVGGVSCWYPGLFGYVGAHNNDTTALYYLNSSPMYWVPSLPNANTAGFQLDMHFWYGNETTYAAAVTAHEKVGHTGWFKAGIMTHQLDFPQNLTFKYMPSVVLQPIPEPSTLVSVAGGVMGLLAYAWRRRK